MIEHTIRTATGTLYIAEAGDGPPVVLLPGFLQSAQRFIDAGWFDALAAEFRVLAIDPVGYGRSSRPHSTDAYRLDRARREVVDALDELQVDRPALVGYSQGSARALDLALADPGRWAGLVLGGTPLFDQGAAFRELGFDVDGMLRQAIAGLKSSDWPSFWQVFPAPLSDDTKVMLAQTNDPVAAGHLLEAVQTALPSFEPLDLVTFAYWSDGENFHATNAEVVAAHDLRHAVGRGAHDEGFLRVDDAMAAIIPFLRSLAD